MAWQDLRVVSLVQIWTNGRICASGACRLFYPAFLQVIDFTELTQREEVDDSPINPFLDFLALFRCLVKI
ncbi:hypothetical protein ACPZB3_002248 [Escherichia coli]